MSKIGTYNLAMTEKVNELGYDTVEEAVADGWDSSEFYASYIKDEQEQAHKEWLEEQASEYGYGSLQEALDNGMKVAYGEHTAYLYREDGQAEAHREWLKEKIVVLGDLRNLLTGMSVAGKSDTTEFGIIKRTIEFIQKGEM